MLNEILKKLRKERKKTQQQLAEYLNIAQNTYSTYETGNAEPNFNTLNKIAEYYDVSIDYLINNCTNQFISKDENEILSLYNKLNESDKNKTKGYMQALIDNNSSNTIYKSFNNNSFNNSNNNNINF